MKTHGSLLATLTLVILLLVTSSAGAGSLPASVRLAPEGPAPTMVSYQGQVVVGTTAYNGTGYFKFAIVDTPVTTSYWSNNGSSVAGSEPTASVPLSVTQGLFTVLLGDTTLSGMTQPLNASVFASTGRYLRVWFGSSTSSFTLLSPDRLITSVPYALQAVDADLLDGQHSGYYQNADNLNAGTLDVARYSAQADLSAEGYLGNAAGDLAQNNGTLQPTLNADLLDGQHAATFQQHYANVVVVAKSGGDFTTVQAAIDSITTANADNPYLVWVAPGVYSETVTMKPYVHLQGAGQDATIITSSVTSSANPPTVATLLLASHTSVRDMTIGNGASAPGASHVAAVRAEDTVTQTLLADVTVLAVGMGDSGYGYYGLINYGGLTLRGGSYTARGGSASPGNNNDTVAIYNRGPLDAEGVTASAESGYGTRGLSNGDQARLTLHGGSFTARGGTYPRGITNDTGGIVVADDITVLAVAGAGTTNAFAVTNIGGPTYGAFMTLRGGSLTARGSTYCIALDNNDHATLTAEGVSLLAETGTQDYGLRNTGTATATLRGGSYTARGGASNAYGIRNENASLVNAESVTALAENASSTNYGVYNTGLASHVILRGGSYLARAGANAYGLHVQAESTLDAENVTVLAENATGDNYGLRLDGAGTVAATRGGAFISRGGASASGIELSDGSTLTADNSTARGEGATGYNRGIHLARTSSSEAVPVASLRGGTFVGHGGTNATGLDSWPGSLTADGIAAIGEDASGDCIGLANGASSAVSNSLLAGRRGGGNNYGLYAGINVDVNDSTLEGATNSVYRSAGTVVIANSRLIGGAVSGTVSCTLVSRGTAVNTGTTCP